VPGNESMQLRQAAGTALEEMFKSASTVGIEMTLSSGYRSYTYQVKLYNGYVQSQGQATADTQSARPGFSEHQTGLAADVEPADRSCELQACFADTPAGQWVASHAYEYGFIIRYVEGKEAFTGYNPEPWHLRYVGRELATEMHARNVSTLEEFFGITGGKTYSE
jgi:D-alanyl-D-alanine carboxypeptidase